MRIISVEKILRFTLAIAVATSMLLPVNLAYADEQEDAENKVASTAAAYDEAVSKLDEVNSQIEENQARLEEINAELPNQQKNTQNAIRELYLLDSNMNSLLDWILGIESLSDAIDKIHYVMHVRSKYYTEVENLKNLKQEAQDIQDSLDNQQKEVSDLVSSSQVALTAAQMEREAVKAAAEAKAAADKAAAEEAVATSKAEQATKSEESTSSTESDDSKSSYDDYSSADDPQEEANDDGANWSSDKDAFVSEWTSRINAYLAGSPMSGCGEYFADAAWTYGVDPRWSPAIAYLESSLGAYCFLPHNAWGWGSSSWGSWQEAIYSHVAGLAAGYGYTISTSAAQKYCPPNWQHWYSVVSGQMNRI